MTPAPAPNFEADQKQWLGDIDRWNTLARVWQKELGELTEEYHKSLKGIEEHADNIEQFSDSVDAHFKRIILDERESVPKRKPHAGCADLCKNHATNASRHEDLFKNYERLQHVQRTMMDGLTTLKKEASQCQ